MNGGLLYQRFCHVTVSSPDTGRKFDFEGLRCKFTVKKTLKKEPNTLDLEITNLSKDTRSKMQSKGARIVLLAGYKDSSSLGQVFSGDARTIDHVRTGPDWTTKVQCGDGERAYASTNYSKAFKPGAGISDVASSIGSALGLDVGNLKTALAKGDYKGAFTQFSNGFVAHGNAAAQFSKVMGMTNLDWSIQDGRLLVLKQGAAESQLTKVTLTPQSGLIGSPEHGTPQKKGAPSVLKVKSLLLPTIACGYRIHVESDGIKGDFVVQQVTHTGDSAGQEWYSDMECLPYKGT